jgi:hypothetical protein
MENKAMLTKHSRIAPEKRKGVFSALFGSFQTLEEPIKERPVISTPFNPLHITHVGYNYETGEFSGLPDRWMVMIKEAGFSKQDQATNHQTILDVIDFLKHSEQQNAMDHVFSKFNNIYMQQLVPDLVQAEKPNSPPLPKKPVQSPGKPKKLDEKPRPPIPARPAHTLSTNSIDVKPTHDSMVEITKDTSTISIDSKSEVRSKTDLTKQPRPAVKPRPKAATSKDVLSRLQELCNSNDPSTLFRNLNKIGQGFFSLS